MYVFELKRRKVLDNSLFRSVPLHEFELRKRMPTNLTVAIQWLISLLVQQATLFTSCSCISSLLLQPLKLDVKRKLSARSDRVKCTDLHPTEPWMLVSLYNGNVHVWNIETQVSSIWMHTSILCTATSGFLEHA